MYTLSFSWCLGMFVLACLAEYVGHRWYLHNPCSQGFFAHAIEHHRDDMREPHHIVFGWRTIFFILVISSPLWVLPLFWGVWISLMWPIVVCWWSLSWAGIHKTCHGLPQTAFMARAFCPWSGAAVRHHLRHHERPTTNFAAVFYWTDCVFGTHGSIKMATKTERVVIRDFRINGQMAFAPATITITPGTTVLWTNESATEHTVTSDTGTFDSNTIAPGAEWSHTFDAHSVGSFPYHCAIHQHMRGVVTVT